MKTEKLEVRLSKQQKEVFQKVANEYGWDLSKLVKETLISFINEQELESIVSKESKLSLYE